jgi:hypothetical protein
MKVNCNLSLVYLDLNVGGDVEELSAFVKSTTFSNLVALKFSASICSDVEDNTLLVNQNFKLRFFDFSK